MFSSLVSQSQDSTPVNVIRNELKVRTPEGIVFAFPLAGVMPRFLAWIVDLLAVGALTGILQKIIGLTALISADFSAALGVLAYFVVTIGYSMVLEWFLRGQTLGKRLLRIRVVDKEGMRLQFIQVLIRNLLRAVDLLPAAYAIGGISCLVTRHSQRLGDLAANTIVIQLEKIREPNLDHLTSGKYNSLRELPHLALRLRQKISPELAKILQQALVRRDQFAPEARLLLFKELADYLQILVPFPEENVESLSDEQYVRNVTEIVFAITNKK